VCALPPKDFLIRISALAQRFGFCRLYAELEASYDFLVIYDFWDCAHMHPASEPGLENRLVAGFVEVGSLLWSAPNERSGGNFCAVANAC
jgi:hypothetical protein